MQELTFEQVEEVSGGLVINPITVMVGVRIIQIATPTVVRVASAIAAAIGTTDGGDAAKP